MLISTRWHRGRLYRDTILKGTLPFVWFWNTNDGRQDGGRFRQRLYFLAGTATVLTVGGSRATQNVTWLALGRWILATSPAAGFSPQSLGEELNLGTIKGCYQRCLQKKKPELISHENIIEKMLSPSTFLGSLVFINSYSVLFFLLRPH